jgi:glycosyltransferase involved in cell wall biosynthesis
VKVLLVNHTSVVSGAELAALDLVAGAATGAPEVTYVLACPRGPFAEVAARRGVRVRVLGGTTASFKLSLRGTLGGAWAMVCDAVRILRFSRRESFDLVHANSIRAGLIAGLARRLGGPRCVVHVRDRLPGGVASSLVMWFLSLTAEHLVAVSQYAADGLSPRLRARTTVVHDGIDLARFRSPPMSRAEARGALGLDDNTAAVGVIGQIAPRKGQATAIEALSLLPARWSDVRLFIVGEVKFATRDTREDNFGYLAALRTEIERLGLQERVTFLGQVPDVERVLVALDVVLVPSWVEPLGNVVIEALAASVPVVVTTEGGWAEVLHDGQDALLVRPRQTELWTRALESLLADARLRSRLAEAGKRTVARFGRDSHAAAVARIYKRGAA